MCLGSEGDFFGGYDYAARAGLVHVANHHVAPGKKQWTWGNHEFGYAWDRNLTERDAKGEFGPYIELMAGVYTDNQPDFSFLQPGETRTWKQYWYPLQKIGPVQQANRAAAVSLSLAAGRGRVGICVTEKCTAGRILLTAKGATLFETTRELEPGRPFVKEIEVPRGVREIDLRLSVIGPEGREIISYQPKPRVTGRVPAPAAEPAPPRDLASADELYLTGLHLEQYRHATRYPTLYWREALRRDPLDARCNNALGQWHLKRGEFAIAEQHFRRAIERLTCRNPNPYDGEPLYYLGLCLRHLGREQKTYAELYKATWNQPWAAASYHALAEIDCARQDWATALEHLNSSLRFDSENLCARNLKAIVLRKLGRFTEAESLLQNTLALDRLDWWARQLLGEEITCDLQTQLDLAHDYARAGFYAEAIELLTLSEARSSSEISVADPNGAANRLPNQSWGALPMVHYTLGWLEQKRGNPKPALKHFKRAGALAPDYCFPSRLEEIAILEAAIAANPRDARAPYYLGNLLYDRRRHEEATRHWEKAARLDPRFSIAWRNLGIAYFNIRRQPARACVAYERAFAANPKDARLLYERDQLWKRMGEKPENRLRELERRPEPVRQRDDLSLELCALYNQTGRHETALALVGSRDFQPWEGGEGGPLGQWVRSHLMLGRAALKRNEVAKAREHFAAALAAPPNLGEARHLLANQSDIHFWLGCALAEMGEARQAKQHWLAAATFKGDFQQMSVRAFSEMTYYSALCWNKLGHPVAARRLFRRLLAYARQLRKAEAKIDFFATSLPAMLLFDDDLQARQETTALFLQAQAWLGLGRRPMAKRLLAQVLKDDPNHALAADLNCLVKEYRGAFKPMLAARTKPGAN